MFDAIRHELTETGILSLSTLISLVHQVESACQYFDLPPTDDVNQFLHNYRSKYYTRQCLFYHRRIREYN